MTDETREKIAALAVAANVAPIVSASKRTVRLARGAPAASFNVTDAVPISPAHSVAAEFAALLTGAQIDPAALVSLIDPDGMVAGVTVTVTTDVAAALSVTVKVTGVLTVTLVGVKMNDAPVIAPVTGTTVGLLDATLNGPLPPVMATVLGVLPNAIKVAGAANSVLETTGVVVELPPPQLESVNTSVEAIALNASLPKKV